MTSVVKDGKMPGFQASKPSNQTAGRSTSSHVVCVAFLGHLIPSLRAIGAETCGERGALLVLRLKQGAALGVQPLRRSLFFKHVHCIIFNTSIDIE